MRQLLILTTLIATLYGTGAFSQTNQGGGGMPLLDGIPEDEPSAIEPTQADSPEADGTVTEPSVAEKIKKQVAYRWLDHQVSKLSREVSANNVRECHDKKVKIVGMKSILQYLEARQSADSNPGKGYTKKAFGCVFSGNARNTLTSVVSNKYFVSYFSERKKWKQQDATACRKYLQTVEKTVKSEQ